MANYDKISAINSSSYSPYKIYRIKGDDPEIDTRLNGNWMKGNRPIDEKHAAKLRRMWKEEDPERLIPITVDIDTYEVLDGQHRITELCSMENADRSKTQLLICFKKFANAQERIEWVRNVNNGQGKWDTSDKYESLADDNEIIKAGKYAATKWSKLVNPKNGENKWGYITSLIYGHILPDNQILGTAKKPLVTPACNVIDDRIELAKQLLKATGYDNIATNTWFERFLKSVQYIHTDAECQAQMNKITRSVFLGKVVQTQFNDDATSTKAWKDYFRETLGLSKKFIKIAEEDGEAA